MTPPEPKRQELLRIAGTIADARPVAWDEVTRDASAADRTVEGLRLIETVAQTFRHSAEPAAGEHAEPALGSWGHLELLEKLGEGGFGEVFRAYDPVLDREVALKLRRRGPSPEATGGRMWLAEAKRLASVRHPNVLTVHGADVRDGRVGIWTDLIAGKTLEELLTEQGPLGAREAVGIGSDLCRALAAVHGAGLAHGDIKTANVMREVGGRIVLMDFGAADRIVGPEDTMPMLVAGTPRAMAPELFRGGPCSPAADIYAVGVLLYRLLTGEYPVEGDSFGALMRAHSEGSRGRLGDARPDLPDALVDVVERALATDPERRFQSAGELGRALRSALPESGAAIEAPVPAGALRQRLSRRVRTGAVAAITVALLALAVWATLGSRDSPPAAGVRVSLAVLPLSRPADEPDEDYLAEGLTQALLSELSGFESLRLIASSSVREALETDASPGAVGTRLEVDAVLTGSTRKIGRKALVSLELVRPASDEVIWAERFERSLGDVFSLQRQIALTVADAIHLELREGEGGGGSDGTELAVAPEVADDYFRARYYWRQRRQESVEKSIEIFRRILDRDPAFAPAWAGLADSYLIMGAWSWLPVDESYPLAKAAVVHALELDPELAEAHSTLATILAEREHDRLAALEHWAIALGLKPGSPDIRNWYAEHLACLGRFDEALANARIYAAQDPLSPLPMQLEGKILYYARHYDEAIEILDRARIRHPENPFSDLYLGLALARQGRPLEGVAVLEAARDNHPKHLVLRVALPGVYLAAGRDAEARSLADELRSGYDELGLVPFHMAHLELDMGDHEEALRWLERSYEARDWQLTFLAVEPLFEPLHGEPRFRDLLERLQLPTLDVEPLRRVLE